MLISGDQHEPTLSSTLKFIAPDEEALKLFIKRVPAVIAVFDKKMRYLITSDRYFTEVGLPDNNIVGKFHYDVVPDIPEKWKIVHQRGLNGEHIYCEADAFYRADGTVEWLKWEVMPWHKQTGEIGGIIIFVEHITKYKLLENKLRATIKDLNRSNDALLKYAHVCAHDLNEPLRAIASYSQLAEQSLLDGNIEDALRYLSVINKNATSQRDFIKSILLYSQLTARTKKDTVISLTQTLREVENLLATFIHNKNAKISYEDLPEVKADKSLITHVFLNLITNGIKFNESIRPEIKITARAGKRNWLFTVKDNGIGIDQAYLTNIFIEFTRLNQRQVYDGSGLGLALCRKIIGAHNGKIWAQSEPGQGSSFYFTLPKKT
jgi:PAS domain S-box-containing protein